MNFNKREILKYIGDTSQMFGVKDYRLNGGKAEGTRAIDVKNGSGLEFTVLPDRCLDISWITYKGLNLSYISSTGIVSPQYFNERGISFLRSFYAGLLTTCGLMNVGSPCNDNGEELGLHGRISNTPGEEVYCGTKWIEDSPVMKVEGKVREARLFGENLTMQREITCIAGENKIKIADTVENCGFKKQPLMLLYHFNLGYPLLDEGAYLLTPTKEVKARDSEAEKGLGEYNLFQKPTSGYSEQVFYHDLKTDSTGNTFAALINEKIEIGIVFSFNKNELFNLTEWKQMGESEYVLGIEPCNCNVSGRADARSKSVLEYIEPGEVRKFNIEIEILDGMSEIGKFKSYFSRL